MLLAIGCALFVLLCLFSWFLALRPRRMHLRGKHVLITGGSRGIGYHTCKEAVRQGARVTVLARNKAKLEQVCNELNEDQGSKCSQWFAVDLTCATEDELLVLVQQAEKEFGRVQVLVNNAGGSTDESFESLPSYAFKAQIDLNYLAAVHVTRAVLPSMKAAGGGRLVFVSSMAGQIGLFGYTAYSGAKFALRGMAEALQMEVAHHNIFVTLVYPPNTDTEGFAAELASMPKETKLISEAGGLWSPQEVALTLL